MDRRTILAFVLITIVIIITPKYLEFISPPQEKNIGEENQFLEDSISQVDKQNPTLQDPVDKVVTEEIVKNNNESSKRFITAIKEEEFVTVSTDLFEAVFSTTGGVLTKWQLKSFVNSITGEPIDLIPDSKKGNLYIAFVDVDGNQISTDNWFFDVKGNKNIKLSQDNLTGEITFIAELEDGKKILKRYMFNNERYSFDIDIEFIGFENDIIDRQYEFVWESGLASTEINIEDDMTYAKSYALLGDELEELDPTTDQSLDKGMKYFTGTTSWVGTRTKYFALAIIPHSEGIGAGLNGFARTYGDLTIKTCRASIVMEFLNKNQQQNHFSVYLGPLDFDVVKSYEVGLEQMMDFGWTIIRPISKLILQSFKFSHQFISNYGVVIILFGFVIKVLFYPLTHKSFTSMKNMQKVQPYLKEVQEKYKDNPKKMQQEVMKVYKEHGVNPLGGCLPMLLQMPVFFALYPVFYSSIELRQAGFAGWITDLSLPDTIYTLPFEIPFYGAGVSLLPIVMAVTMFIQQKMTVTDPKQKALVYMMPIMMLFFFNLLPSGLVLYWTVFNLLSIAQQSFSKGHA